MRIAIAGSGRLASGLMRALMDSPHAVVALIQNGRTFRGIRRWFTTSFSYLDGSSVIGEALRHHVPVLWINRMDEGELAPLRALKPDVLLVAGFSIIFKRPLLELPKIGCVNTHSSLLPRHRGPNPFSAAILAGERQSGVTFHVMDEGIDTGAILEQHAFDIDAADNAMDVYSRASDLAARHVVALMDRVERDGLRGAAQDSSLACYDAALTKDDSYIRWTDSAETIDRRIRACKPFFLTRFPFQNQTIIVSQLTWDSTPSPAPAGTVIEVRPRVRIATGQGVVTLVLAYIKDPVPWVWPAPWSRPEPGDRVE